MTPESRTEGFLEVCRTERFEVIIVHTNVPVDKDGVGYIGFSPDQARALATLLIAQAVACDEEYKQYKADVSASVLGLLGVPNKGQA